MTFFSLFTALAWLLIFILIGAALKRFFFPSLIVPSALIGGILAFIFNSQFLAYVGLSESNFLFQFLPSNEQVEIWKSLPQHLIVVVFAGIFLGKKVPSVSEALKLSNPNLVFGYTLALGQYIVGILFVTLVLSYFIDVEAVTGALIAVAFQGGHGTVAGLSSTFDSLDLPQAQTIGLGLATIGLLSAIISGTLIANYFDKKSKRRGSDNSDDDKSHESEPDVGKEEKNRIDVRPVTFSIQVAVLATVIWLAYLFLDNVQSLEQSLFSEESSGFFKYMPLFPIAMLTGLAVQKFIEACDKTDSLSNYHITIVSNLALDLLIVAALGSLDASLLAESGWLILLLGAVGIAYNLVVFFVVAPRIFDCEDWHKRGLGEIGQSMGTTAVGLLLLKQSNRQSGSRLKAFSYKQPLYEPIVGGGLVTALAIPFIYYNGAWLFIGIAFAVLSAIWGAYYLYHKHR